MTDVIVISLLCLVKVLDELKSQQMMFLSHCSMPGGHRFLIKADGLVLIHVSVIDHTPCPTHLSLHCPVLSLTLSVIVSHLIVSMRKE